MVVVAIVITCCMNDEETWSNICLVLKHMFHNHLSWCWCMNGNGLVLGRIGRKKCENVFFLENMQL